MSAENILSDGEVPHEIRALYRKVNIPGWQWYRAERIGSSNDVLYQGCVPNGVYSRGPRKGRPRFTGGTRDDKCVITGAEVAAEKARWEAETGKCGECLGRGQVWFGWSAAEGHKYRDCSVCKKDAP